MSLYQDYKLNRDVWILKPSQYYVNKKTELISTILGSCVAVCIRDVNNKIGGMNHFLLPYKVGEQPKEWPIDYESEQLRYGDLSMELLINKIVQRGGQRNYLEAKIFGGATLVDKNNIIGDSNIKFAREFLNTEQIPITAEDVGGYLARKIYYDCQNGEVIRYLVPNHTSRQISTAEARYHKHIIETPLLNNFDILKQER